MNPYKFQEKAIANLTETFKRLWQTDNDKIDIVFKSPTGSGKTFMMCSFVNNLNIQPDWNDDVAFVWITFSDELAMQSRTKFYDYFFPNLSNKLLTISDFSQGKLNHNDVMFLNWQKLVARDAETRLRRRPNDERRLKESGYYFEDIVENTHAEGRRIIMIIDESHKNVTAAAMRDVINPLNPKIILKVSATPEEEINASDMLNNRAGFVEVTRNEVITEGLIKKEIVCQTEEDLSAHQGADQDTLLIDLAMERKEQIRREWERAGKKINPLVLVQLPNDERNTTNDAETKEQIVRRYLTQNGVNESRIVTWTADKPLDKNSDITDNESKVDYLLFKYAAGTGWDCPRAHVLVMYREIQSSTFYTQTLGRIIRMAAHDVDFEKYPLLHTGYLYTNYARNQVQMPPDLSNKPKVFTSQIQPEIRQQMATDQFTRSITETVSTVEKDIDKAKAFAENINKTIQEKTEQIQTLKDNGATSTEIMKVESELHEEVKKQAIETFGKDNAEKILPQTIEAVQTCQDTNLNRRDTEFVLDEHLISDFISRTDYGDLGKSSLFQTSFIQSMNQYFGIDEIPANLEQQKARLTAKQIDVDPTLKRDMMVGVVYKTDSDNDTNNSGKDIKYEVSNNDIEKGFNYQCALILKEQTEDAARVGNIARSWSLLKEALRQWFAKYALPSYGTIDYYKVFLNDVLKEASSSFRPAITKALKDYRPTLDEFQKAKRESEEASQSRPFTIKTSYAFTEDDKVYENSGKSIVQPFRLSKQYENETKFIDFLEQQNDVKWWFKNGDQGKDYLAFRYFDTSEKKEKLFYPDWIIMFKNGEIGIFDTKSGITAQTCKDKAEALQKRLVQLNTFGKRYIGGIVIFANGVWLYNNNVEYTYNPNDLSGWKNMP